MFQVFASILLGLHWWNPFVWLAWHQLRNEAEAATDAWVLRRTGPDAAPSYGAMLLDVLARLTLLDEAGHKSGKEMLVRVVSMLIKLAQSLEE